MTIEAVGSITLTEQVASDAIRYLLLNAGIGGGGNVDVGNAVTSNSTTGEITTNDGVIIGYLYQYMSVRYATSPTGSSNFSNNYANTTYIGLRNSPTQLTSENPGDYVWTEVNPPFGDTFNPYYRATGGRDFRINIGANPPDSSWALIPTAPSNFIDLDRISGVVGSNGQSAFLGVIYRRSATQPVTPPTGSSSFNFASGVFVPPTNWLTSIPADDGNPVWVATTIFLANYQGTAVDEGWSTPQLGFQNGNTGTPGTSYYEFAAYTESPPAAPPPTPTGGYWDFNTQTGGAPTSTGGFTWTITPANTNVWASFSLATSANGANANNLSWSSPTLLAVSGTAGTDGLSTFQWPIYRQSNVGVPAIPTGGTYRFGDPANSVLPANWYSTATSAVAAEGNGVVYVSQGIASRQGTSGDSTNIISWSVPIQYLGENGTNGSNGQSTYIWPIYQANLNAPPTPTGGGPWNFTTANGEPPTNWYNSANPAWIDPVWVCQTVVSSNTGFANVGTWSDPVRWSGPAGANGVNGLNGTNSYSFITTPPIIVIPATFGGIPTGNLPNITLSVLSGANYVEVNGASGSTSNVLWSWDSSNTGGSGTGVSIGNAVVGLYQVQWPITQSSNVNSTITIANITLTTDGNIANGVVIGNVQIPVTQVRAGQSPGWYEITVPNTSPNSISTYPYPITGDNANFLTNAWRTQYNFSNTTYPADTTILKFNQDANSIDGNIQYAPTAIYGQWDSVSNSYLGFTSITNGNTIIDGTLNTLEATVGNSISSIGFVPTFYANGVANTETAPQYGWSITKDGKMYAKEAYLDGANISNIAVDSLVSGSLGDTVMSLGNGRMVIDSRDPSITNYTAVGSGDYVQITAGDVKVFVSNEEYAVLTRNVVGTATNANVVNLPGLWRTTPSILVSPNDIQTYDANLAAQSQSLRFQVTDLEEYAPRQWRFTPTATLSVSSATSSLVVDGTGTSTGQTSITLTATSVLNVNQITVPLTFSSVKSSGTLPQYNRRRVSFTATFTGPSTYNITNTIDLTTGFTGTTSINSPVMTPGSYDVSIVVSFADLAGTFVSGSDTNPRQTVNLTAGTYSTKTTYTQFNSTGSVAERRGTGTWPSLSMNLPLTWSTPFPSGWRLISTSLNIINRAITATNAWQGGGGGTAYPCIGAYLGNTAGTSVSITNAQTNLGMYAGTQPDLGANVNLNRTETGNVTSYQTQVVLTNPYRNLTNDLNGYVRISTTSANDYYMFYNSTASQSNDARFEITGSAVIEQISAGDTIGLNTVSIGSGGATQSVASSNMLATGTLNWVAIGY